MGPVRRLDGPVRWKGPPDVHPLRGKGLHMHAEGMHEIVHTPEVRTGCEIGDVEVEVEWCDLGVDLELSEIAESAV